MDRKQNQHNSFNISLPLPKRNRTITIPQPIPKTQQTANPITMTIPKPKGFSLKKKQKKSGLPVSTFQTFPPLPKPVAPSKDFFCGCGKSYQSHAALYTHVKTKHEGVFPHGSSEIKKKKQGRPRKAGVNTYKPKSEESKIHDFHTGYTHFLDIVPGAKKRKKEKNNSTTDSFPFCHFDENEGKSFEKEIKGMEDTLYSNFGGSFDRRYEELMGKLRVHKDFKIGDVICLFLLYNFPQVTGQFYRELVFFFHGYKRKLVDTGLGDKSCEFVLDVVNDFIFDELPLLKKKLDLLFGKSERRNGENTTDGFILIGVDNIKILRVLLLMKHFCNWLNVCGFSGTKLDLHRG